MISPIRSPINGLDTFEFECMSILFDYMTIGDWLVKVTPIL